MLDARYWMLDSRYWIFDIECDGYCDFTKYQIVELSNYGLPSLRQFVLIIFIPKLTDQPET